MSLPPLLHHSAFRVASDRGTVALGGQLQLTKRCDSPVGSNKCGSDALGIFIRPVLEQMADRRLEEEIVDRDSAWLPTNTTKGTGE